MPAPEVDVAYQLTVAIAGVTFDHEITNVRWDGMERATIDTTHLTTATGNKNDTAPGTFGGRTFLPGPVSNPGQLECDLHFDPDDMPQLDIDAQNVTVTWNDAATTSQNSEWVCSGYVQNFSVRADENDKMTASCTIKFSGLISLTAAD